MKGKAAFVFVWEKCKALMELLFCWTLANVQRVDGYHCLASTADYILALLSTILLIDLPVMCEERILLMRLTGIYSE